ADRVQGRAEEARLAQPRPGRRLHSHLRRRPRSDRARGEHPIPQPLEAAETQGLVDVGLIEAIQSPDMKAKASPMQHDETRDWLRKHGFDLAKQLSWWDDPETNCRHFTQ